jgi:hypothetical protein
MRETMLSLIDSLMESGKKAGDTNSAAFKGLEDLRQGLIDRTPHDDLSENAQAALEAIIMMALTD